VCVLADESKTVSFTEFVTLFETRLRQSLTAAFGVEGGKDASAEALAYGWEHWHRIRVMDNPGGYLYRVGYDRARKVSRRSMRLPGVDSGRLPWVEPGLPKAVAGLPEQQRMVVSLVFGYQWSLGEVAEYLGVAKGTVQTHSERGLARLRDKLGVEL
jgi:DNA-directed RNA polymerase specialized sigma24 family protein